ncbi:hypothetical protein HYH02_015176 [Chlamydomonas schloesseri]|uniref:Mitogen-activated protein kinase n=1 Tax=Chlamydomonas schloesseri TaxID=2026947 RepID=A0A835SRB2_9CHLO|nr:hypothetical protein HYH02_015176 [Chlamydomonas schloesseri]|eukprot:KAG2424506.1 hypothetical protein HYH02_015176 [Chlamydomonas schloesseri]
MNQLDRIVEFCGRPSPSDVEAIDSPFAATMMESCAVSQARRLQDMFPHASPDAADLLRKLLVFNPHKRLTAEQALRHPYVAQFHNLADEPVCNRIIVLPISDNTKYTVSEYRERLYGEILKKKKEVVRQMREREAAMAAARAASSTPVPGGGGSSSGAYHGHGHHSSSGAHRTSVDNAARRRSLDNPSGAGGGAGGGRSSTTNAHYSSTGAYGAARR